MLSDFFQVINGNMTVMQMIMGVIASLTVIFLVTPFHECAHAFIADKLGDPTAKNQGRLTLNPLVHLDVIGAALIVFLGFGWAKPVPVQPYFFKKPKRDMALVGAAGPISNLIAAIIGGLILNAIYAFATLNIFVTYIIFFLTQYISLNIVLAVFNLIPVPPLDGSRIIGAFFPDSWLQFIYRYEKYIFLVLILCSFSGIFSRIISLPYQYLFNGIIYLTGLPFGNF